MYWPAAKGEVTGEAIRKFCKHKPAATVEEIPVDPFFASLAADKDWYGDEEKAIAERYRTLAATVQATLTDPKVARIAAAKMCQIHRDFRCNPRQGTASRDMRSAPPRYAAKAP